MQFLHFTSYQVRRPYNLLKAGYYVYLAQEAKTEGNTLLAKEYTLQAGYLGYNTHYANYSLGWEEMKKGADYPAKTYFYNAIQRFPSPYTLVNYGNLDAEINTNKVQAIYKESLRKEISGEVENNLGVLQMQKGELERALGYFEKADPLNEWNNAPLVNKWNVFKKIEMIDSSAISSDYANGNFGVKSNILTTQISETNLTFEYNGIEIAGYLHRHAYLLNSSYLFTHDSIESLVRKEVEKSTDGTHNSRLKKALAIHLYNKGEVSEAFMMLDHLQANAHQYYKSEYLDALGKLAMDQQAYRLALEFFDQALDVKHTKSIFSRLEVLARMGKKNKIPDELLKILRKNPELTEVSNIFLEKLEDYQIPTLKDRAIPSMSSLSENELIALGRMNVFHVSQVIAVVDELKRRDASGGYELLVDATDINPYSTELLKKYTLVALDWNLIEYAKQTLDRLKKLLSEEDYKSFKDRVSAAQRRDEETFW